MSSHDETLFLELLGDVTGRGAGDFDPGFGEDGTGHEHVDNEDSGFEGVGEGFSDAERRRPGSTGLVNEK